MALKTYILFYRRNAPEKILASVAPGEKEAQAALPETHSPLPSVAMTFPTPALRTLWALLIRTATGIKLTGLGITIIGVLVLWNFQHYGGLVRRMTLYGAIAGVILYIMGRIIELLPGPREKKTSIHGTDNENL